VETGHISVAILFLIIAANPYGRMLALSGLPANRMGFAAAADLGFYGTVTVYIVAVLLLGMILDSISIMLITLPLIIQLDGGQTPDLLVWFGVAIMVLVTILLVLFPELSLVLLSSGVQFNRGRMMDGSTRPTLNDADADLLFRKARTQNGFLATAVPPDLLRQLYDLMKWGRHRPTATRSESFF